MESGHHPPGVVVLRHASDAFREGLHLRGIPLHEVPQDGIHPAEELRIKPHSRRGDVVPELLRT